MRSSAVPVTSANRVTVFITVLPLRLSTAKIIQKHKQVMALQEEEVFFIWSGLLVSFGFSLNTLSTFLISKQEKKYSFHFPRYSVRLVNAA